MTEHALDILTDAAIQARRHACNETESRKLTAFHLVVVLVGAVVSIWAFLPEKMNVAQLELLNSVNLGFVIVLARWINTLPSSVACDDLVTVGGLIRWYSSYWWGRSSRLCSPTGHIWRSLGSNESVGGDGGRRRRSRQAYSGSPSWDRTIHHLCRERWEACGKSI